jgi:isoleucyl-tRNA synthetase
MNSSIKSIEEKILDFWRKHRVFEKSVEARKGKKPFVFYEGPPTANAGPGIHHFEARAFKDFFCRYQTMRGRYVLRRAGWDTHGLPVEIQVEKELGLKTKQDVERYGIAKFNARCRASVWNYKQEWDRFTHRMGYWIDLEHPYVTFENEYIESLWWVVQQIWKKKLLYKDFKVVPFCSRCGTALSSHEVALGYETVKENSLYLKFKLKPNQKFGKLVTDDRTYILSWTTTPWTLPGNVALAVGEKIKYLVLSVETSHGREKHLIAEECFKR